jgi:hypothetical protein
MPDAEAEEHKTRPFEEFFDNVVACREATLAEIEHNFMLKVKRRGVRKGDIYSCALPDIIAGATMVALKKAASNPDSHGRNLAIQYVTECRVKLLRAHFEREAKILTKFQELVQESPMTPMEVDEFLYFKAAVENPECYDVTKDYVRDSAHYIRLKAEKRARDEAKETKKEK